MTIKDLLYKKIVEVCDNKMYLYVDLKLNSSMHYILVKYKRKDLIQKHGMYRSYVNNYSDYYNEKDHLEDKL